MSFQTLDEYAIRRKFNDITFFMWLITALVVGLAVVTLPVCCDKLEEQKTAKTQDSSKRSLPYARRPGPRPERE